MRVHSVHRYPVKSMGGEDLTSAVVEPWGLAGDRRWMVVDAEGRALTAREAPALLRVRPTLTADGVLLRCDRRAVAARPEEPLVEVTVWGDTVKATPAGPEASSWLSELLGVAVRLVFLDDPTRRPVDPRHGRPADRVSFADGYPLLLTSTSSLEQLETWVAAGPHAAEGPLPMSRFRPSVVVEDVEPWAEDGWRLLRIGAAQFRSVKPCARCVITTTDPLTGRRGREPLASLARHRNIDGGLLFGVNLVPDGAGERIAVGDAVEVLG
ncbi:MOSC domain-containing protein [Nocardioides terrisoli]|uniref:MOSC domain-containing protein n=1 Tax=Nocardioides terrisoli TaxID=3388267 RepID=UPI00287B8FFE|nr:MOSC N-terminal beta barrel domain-containing protein [Nocardioides marmorisolisilvae]